MVPSPKRFFAKVETSDEHGGKYKEPTTMTAAASFNRIALKKLTAALEKDPEVDLTTMLSLNYTSRLAARKTETGRFFINIPSNNTNIQ